MLDVLELALPSARALIDHADHRRDGAEEERLHRDADARDDRLEHGLGPRGGVPRHAEPGRHGHRPVEGDQVRRLRVESCEVGRPVKVGVGLRDAPPDACDPVPDEDQEQHELRQQDGGGVDVVERPPKPLAGAHLAGEAVQLAEPQQLETAQPQPSPAVVVGVGDEGDGEARDEVEDEEATYVVRGDHVRARLELRALLAVDGSAEGEPNVDDERRVQQRLERGPRALGAVKPIGEPDPERSERKGHRERHELEQHPAVAQPAFRMDDEAVLAAATGGAQQPLGARQVMLLVLGVARLGRLQLLRDGVHHLEVDVRHVRPRRDVQIGYVRRRLEVRDVVCRGRTAVGSVIARCLGLGASRANLADD
eukprot:5498436-Prymnesium_polylepis.2